jgi:hypothetical protein
MGPAGQNDDCKPVVFKGNFERDTIQGEGIVLLRSGLIIIGQFNDGQLRDT